MVKKEKDEMDLQKLTENVSFLADCFDNSFAIQSSLNYVKNLSAEREPEQCVLKNKSSSSRNKRRSHSKTVSDNNLTLVELTRSTEGINCFRKKLKNWGLPHEIVKKYEKRGITEMFDWQVDCLGNSKVLLERQNLVYSAPTSAGKTLVAEILAIKTILERQKKVMIILPFVSIVREKMFYLQDILSSSGIRVEGFMGSQSPPGGFEAVHIAICTIEKANSLVNKMLDEGNISQLGTVIVDELHLLGDSHRGYILELLLTKIKYVSLKCSALNIQIIGMSATLPNLEELANWLDAQLYITEFRPIPLSEYCLVGNKYYDKNGKYVRVFDEQDKSNHKVSEHDYILSLSLETIKEGCSVLIFCMTKNRCENLAQSLASSFYKLGCTDNEQGTVLKEQLKSENILEVLEQLKNCPAGLDQILKKIVSFGVAYHHAGLTFDERDIIEGAFKSGAIRVLVATSTLSSGVNLPARRVIIRSPLFQRQPVNILTYKQMIGRAGRMGKDALGESILLCTPAEQKIGLDLMMGSLDPVASCIESKDKFMRAVLEIIASQDLCKQSDLVLYTQCTLLYAQQSLSSSKNDVLDDALKELFDFELIRIQTDQIQQDEKQYIATSLGKACLSSSMSPNDGLSLFCELQKARQCLVLETDLHLIYLVTPYSVSIQWNDIDWLHLLTLWESLTTAMKRVGELVGIEESFIIRCLRNNKSLNNLNKLNIHKRFYTALALQDLVNEVSLSEVAQKFQCARGFLQGLQQASATFAGMVTAFCRQLGWKNMEILMSQFQDRLQFGIHSELLELMKLPSLNGIRARTLFDAGFETISSIASADVNVIENSLYKSMPFQSEKEREGDDEMEVRKRNRIKNIWITGYCGLTARSAAENLILEARKYLTQEIGVTEIKWKDKGFSEVCLNNPSATTIDVNKDNTRITQGYEKYSISRVKQAYEKNNDSQMVIKKETTDKDINNLSDQYNTSIKCSKVAKQITEVHVIKKKVDLIETSLPYKNCYESGCIDSINSNHSKRELNQKIGGNRSNILFVPIEKELIWESLNLPNTLLENVTKLYSSDIFLSPNISFTESNTDINNRDINNTLVSKTISDKDISLFSSEGSSIFEESFSLDIASSTSIESKHSDDNIVISTESNIDSKSLLNAFASPVIKIDEEDDFKLVYDDEKQDSEDIKGNINKFQEYGNYTQDFEKLQFRNSFSSPLKRRGCIDKEKSVSITKKLKPDPVFKNNGTLKLELKSLNNTNITLKFDKNEVCCNILREEEDINTSFITIENTTGVSIVLNTSSMQKTSKNVIGRNIIFKERNISVENMKESQIQGIAFCVKYNMCLYVDFTLAKHFLPLIKLKLGRLFSNTALTFKIFSIKSKFIKFKKWLGKDFQSNCMDISLMEWLLNNDEKMYKIKDLMKKYCHIDFAENRITVGGEEKYYADLDTIEAACLNAWCIWTVAEKQNQTLLPRYQYMEGVLHMETQIAKILGNCEYYGINVDKNLASQLLIDVKNSQEILQKKAFKLCGYHFNFNSSKDVAKVLGIYKGRKVSTKKSVLSIHNTPMASIMIFWRKLNSILTKILYPLTEKAFNYSVDDRISPSYTMFTCTGRISMHEPNLQNVPRTFAIPVKYLTESYETESKDDVIEFNCRNVFKASPGYFFVSADYCQLEMRILTHYCEDAILTGIMRSNVDVFKSIAASWGGVREEQVDDDLRQKAKQLCYGILYGMGNRTLAQHMDVSELEAAAFTDTFYKTYPGIKVFTQSVIKNCRKNGYVETLMKRRRYLPDINSNIVSKRSSAERQAVNTMIQGSAADIAKAAMCAIDTNTDSETDKPRLILQMHDELIYEVAESMKTKFIVTIKKLMEDTVKLNVPLPVKVKTGCAWGSMKEASL